MDNELNQFRQQIANYFSLADLEALAFDLNLNWDELAGQTLSAKIMSLVIHLHHQERLPELISYLAAARPHLDWPTPDQLSQYRSLAASVTPSEQGPMDRFYSFVAAHLPGEAWEPRNKLALLRKVHSFWVDGVLNRSVHGMAMLDLGKEEAAKAVDTPRPWKMVVEVPEQTNWQAPAQRRIIDIYGELDVQMERTLLILGAPGSGKTTTLLELARDSVTRAEHQPDLPLPVVFNLSSWGDKQQPLSDWLVEEFNLKYQIPKKLGQEWVANDALMLLLDGLDEVRVELRGSCVQAINAFRQDHSLVPIVVCSRTEDYEMLSSRLQFQRAIRLLPLKPDQIEAYLDFAGEPLASLRLALAQDEILQEMAQSPLMLSIMSLAYRDIPVASFVNEALATTEARRRHLFDAYVERMLRRRGESQTYTPQQTIKWLSWLAQNMAKHSQSVFLLEQLQPSWLSNPRWRWGYLLLERFLEGVLLYGVVWALLVSVGSTNIGVVFLLPMAVILLVMAVRWAIWRLERDPVRDFELLQSEKKRRFFFQRKKRLTWSYRIVEAEMITGWLVLLLFVTILTQHYGLLMPEVPDPGVFWLVFLSLLAGGLLGMLLGSPSSIVFAIRQPVTAMKAAIRTREGLSWSWHQFGQKFLLIGLLPFGLAFTLAFLDYREGLQTSVLLRDGQTGAVIATMTGHEDAVASATFSPNARFLLTTNDDKTARLWDGQTGAELAVVPASTLDVHSASFSADGRFFVVAGDQGNFRLWDAESGTEVAVLSGHTVQATSYSLSRSFAAFSPDGRFILTLTNDSARLWDGPTGAEIAELSGHPGTIWLAEFSPDGRLILTTGIDQTLRLWDGETGVEVAVSTVDLGSGLFTEFSDDGSRILGWSGNGVQIWDGRTGEKIAFLDGHGITSAVYGPDGRHVVTTSTEDAARLWDGQTGVEIALLRSPTDRITSAAFSPDGRSLATGSADASTYLWDAHTGEQIAVLEGHSVPEFVSGLVGSKGYFSPDDRFLLTTGWDDSARLWDAETGAAIATLRGPAGTRINHAQFSPDGRFIVTEIIGAPAYLWDAQTAEEIGPLEGHENAIDLIHFSPDGSRLLTATEVTDGRPLSLLAWIPGLLIGTFYGLQSRVLESKKMPNEGIRLTLKNGLLVAVIIAIIVSLPLASSDISALAAISAMLIGYYVFVWFAGINVVRHYILRLMLILNQRTPRNYVHFLDFATDRIFLQKVGGGYYIFIHRLLLEYFASRSE